MQFPWLWPLHPLLLSNTTMKYNKPREMDRLKIQVEWLLSSVSSSSGVSGGGSGSGRLYFNSHKG